MAVPAHDGRRRWVSERLRIGDESRVTQAIRRVKGEADPAMQGVKDQLGIAYTYESSPSVETNSYQNSGTPSRARTTGFESTI